MAISKILYIGDCGAGYAGKHLKQALDYIMEPYKTGGGEWVAALNCQKESAYQQMRQTKEVFGKTDQRQGYHLIISFVEGEVGTQTAFEIVDRFAKEYLGRDYEALYAVHDNTEHIHGHIIFNSVSFRNGIKYRYKKGDWAKKIQPISNRLCEEYGLSTIEISEDMAQSGKNYHEWNDFREDNFVWSDMIKRDIDACILQSSTYESFMAMLSDMGYKIKNAYRSEGKYLAIKPMGMTRYRRCKNLGENYTEERIRERILSEDLSKYHAISKEMPLIVPCRVKKYRRAKLSGIQKKYFARLYRIGQLKNRAYSQAWKYRDDIRRMEKLQEDYLFLNRHEINTMEGIAAVAENLLDKRKEISQEKSRVYKERARLKALFDMAEEIKGLQECENCYKRGEKLFEAEHDRWQELSDKLEKEGYSLESVDSLKVYYRNEVAWVREKEKAVAREERIAKRILREFLCDSEGKGQYKAREEVRNQERNRQPLR